MIVLKNIKKMSKIKPKFTEKEIEELNIMYEDWGYQIGVYEVISFIKKELNISDVHKVSINLRKHFNSKIRERSEKFEKEFKNSTLSSKLIKRIDYE